MKDWEGPIAFTPEQWDEPSPALKYWAEKQLSEAQKTTYFHRFRTKPAPRPWWRRQWTRHTWKLRESLRGLRMGWRGELGWREEEEDWYLEREIGLTMDEIMKQPIDPYSTHRAMSAALRDTMDRMALEAARPGKTTALACQFEAFITGSPDARIKYWSEDS